jgi:membrane-bound lytic murein transglycosylase B
VWDYFDNRVHEQSVATGRAMARKWKPWLDRIEAKYGVDRHILLAIWSMESNYGEILKNDKVMRNVVRSLATLAYADQRRAKFARTQLIAALKILQRGDIDESHLTGSWAGAMGHTQFIPTSYQAYAVDMDGNGKRDIWNSIPDALATAANLLRKNGWQSGKTWGYEVALPQGRKFPGGSLSLADWEQIGVARARGKPFSHPSDKAELKVLDGRSGPAFLMTKNFFVIKSYNNADKYALAVGLLADEIAGYGGLVQDWNRPFTRLSFEEKQELQQRLSAYGYYDGKFDGKIGEGSRAAIKAFQARSGLTQDGHPSMEVLSTLRKK